MPDVFAYGEFRQERIFFIFQMFQTIIDTILNSQATRKVDKNGKRTDQFVIDYLHDMQTWNPDTLQRIGWQKTMEEICTTTYVRHWQVMWTHSDGCVAERMYDLLCSAYDLGVELARAAEKKS